MKKHWHHQSAIEGKLRLSISFNASAFTAAEAHNRVKPADPISIEIAKSVASAGHEQQCNHTLMNE